MAVLSGCSRDRPEVDRTLSEQRVVDAGHPASVTLHSNGASAWLVEIDQHDLDVWIQVLDEKGLPVSATDSPSRRSGVERALLQLPAASFRAIVHSAEHPAKRATIRIDVSTIPAEQQRAHPQWMEAQIAETRAARAFRTSAASEPPASDADKDAAAKIALNSYLLAARRWRSLGDSLREAAARHQAGWIWYRLLGDPAAAARSAERAAALLQRAGHDALAAQSMLLAASTMVEAPGGRYQRAAGQAEAARRIFERNRDEYGVAESIHALASINHYAGQFVHAQELFNDAEERYRRLGERDGVHKATANAAHMAYQVGRFREAAEIYDRILATNAPGSDPGMYADTLDNSAQPRTIIGEFESALQQYELALDLHERMRDEAGQGRSLSGIGIAYQRIGDESRAVQYLKQATDLRRKVNARKELITDLIALAGAHRELGQKEQARVVLQEARDLAKSESRRDQNRVSLAIARNLTADRSFDAAGQHLSEIVTDTTDDNAAVTLQATLALGQVQTELGDYAAALSTLQRARDLFSTQGAPIFEAEALYWMAQAHRRRGDFSLALDHTRAAIAIAERIRASATNPDFRSRLLATRRAMYDLQVNLLLDRYGGVKDAGERALLLSQALQASDQSRARTLSDLLAMASSEHGATPDNRQLHRLATDIAAREYQLARLRDDAPHAPQIERMRREIMELRSKFDLALSRLPAHESPGASVAPTHERASMPADAITLTYFLSAERCFLWIGSGQGLEGVELADHASITAAIARLHRDLLRLEASGQPGNAHAIDVASKLLLPRKPALARASTWIVVPDGAIHHVPFAALRVSKDETSSARTQFSVERHAILIAPTYGTALRVALNLGTLSVSTAGPAVIFGDPVYARNDARLASLRPEAQSVSPARTRLSGTVREIERIAVHLRDARPVILSGFDATREAALSEATSLAAVVHFAAHATFDARNPARTGIELAALTRDGRNLSNLLTPLDLAAARMQATLVVLSACESALGEELDGEGPIGLSYGFLSAGSRAVIATQWRVADAATAELMDRFYAHATTGGLLVHEALRAAQLDLLHGSQWREPMFWAGAAITATR
jgi:CHAT domain-containing protein